MTAREERQAESQRKLAIAAFQRSRKKLLEREIFLRKKKEAEEAAKEHREGQSKTKQH